jgi:aldose 1-epimerase
MAVFPFAHRLELRAVVDGGALTIETTIVATGSDPVPMAFGFHPYLAPPGAPRERWEIELPAMAHLALDERDLPTGGREPWPAQRFALGDRTFDDAFAPEADAARFAVTDGARRIEVAFEHGFPYAQVFAPPGQALICFEPMTAPTDALRTHDGLRCVAAGERAGAAFALRVRAV